MKQRESPTEFAFALRSLAEGAFPNATPAQIEAFLLDQFLYGIPDDLRMAVIEKSNFESAYRKAQMLHLAGNNLKVRISDDVETFGYQFDRLKIKNDDDTFLISQKPKGIEYYDDFKKENERFCKSYDYKRRDYNRNHNFRQRSNSRDRNYKQNDFRTRDISESTDRSYRDYNGSSPYMSDSNDRLNSINYYKRNYKRNT